MRNFTFVWYPSMPIACEGDDFGYEQRIIMMRLKCKTRIEQAINALENRHGGYVLLWS